jgi:hypothetical protein
MPPSTSPATGTRSDGFSTPAHRTICPGRELPSPASMAASQAPYGSAMALSPASRGSAPSSSPTRPGRTAPSPTSTICPASPPTLSLSGSSTSPATRCAGPRQGDAGARRGASAASQDPPQPRPALCARCQHCTTGLSDCTWRRRSLGLARPVRATCILERYARWAGKGWSMACLCCPRWSRCVTPALPASFVGNRSRSRLKDTQERCCSCFTATSAAPSRLQLQAATSIFYYLSMIIHGTCGSACCPPRTPHLR